MKSLLLYGALAALLLLSACHSDQVAPAQTVALKPQNEFLTVINWMKPDAADQQKVVDLLDAGLEQTMKQQPGFVSASVHQSLDNGYVINYAVWENEAALQAAASLVNGGEAPNMAEAFGLSQPDYHPYALTAQYKTSENLPTIDAKGEWLTIINVLQPANGVTQQELATLLKEALQEEILVQDGFISATIHESLDNNYIINYAQWRDQAALDAMVARLQSGGAPKLGTAFSQAQPDFHPFTVVQHYFPD